MVKVNCISHSVNRNTRQQESDITPHSYTPNQEVHRHEKPREFVRAVNATKYQKMFAKPFIAHLNDHKDTPKVLTCHRMQNLSSLVSGSCDGELIWWDLANKKPLWKVPRAHNGFVTGVECSTDPKKLFSSGRDGYVRIWSVDEVMDVHSQQKKPIDEKLGPDSILTMGRHQTEDTLATGGDSVCIWDGNRLAIKQQYDPEMDSIQCLRFHSVEQYLLGMTARDRSVCLYDIRSGNITKRFKMQLKSTGLCFNPYQPYRFTIANDDKNCYTFDMRYMEKGPQIMHTGFVNAVTSIDYHPAGHEFVAGGYDSTIRIYRVDETNYKPREIYFTKRMNRVMSVKYSLDGEYIYSGSDDFGIRIWKTNSQDPLRMVNKFEKQKFDYNNALVERYKEFEDVKSIASKLHVPKLIHKQSVDELKSRIAFEKREKNRIRYSMKLEDQKRLERTNKMKRRFLGVKKVARDD